MAISMRLGTCRRSVVATATGLPRCARNDRVGTNEVGTDKLGAGEAGAGEAGTDEVGAGEAGTLERWGGLTLLVVTDRIFALPDIRH